MRVHDTIGGKVELTWRDPGRASLYVCGPTVYDVPHLGHARGALVFDTIRRYLEWTGLEVLHVINVTDIDDKIIARAAAEGRDPAQVAIQYEDAYWCQLDRMEVLRPHHIPHATGYLAEMIELIACLVALGHAYLVPEYAAAEDPLDGGGPASVYFGVGGFPGYGALSHRRLADLLEGAGSRVEVDERKRSPVDFALWKATKPGEPSWPSPWGPGRPGWHIECSAMSLALLGEGFDLHGGGDDLVFPHHENERAQAEAAGRAFARHWLHNGMVVVGGEKMSKSLGNFTTLAEALDGFGPRALRLAVLRTHYRSPTELGIVNLADAVAGLARLDALLRRAEAAGIPPGDPDETAVGAFRAAMEDDFNTPAALGLIYEVVRRANLSVDQGDKATSQRLVAAVTELMEVLHLGPVVDGSRPGSAPDGEADREVDRLVLERDVARRARDWALADRIRARLVAQGIVLEDTPTSTIWHR